MRKRDRSHQSHSLPSNGTPRRPRQELVSSSTSPLSRSDSVEIVEAMSHPTGTGGPSGEAPKEAHADDSQTTSQAPAADAPLDPHLEQQMDELALDNDFRESIRAMSPNTQREVLNDIIRSQQFAYFDHDARQGHFHGAMEASDDDDDHEDDHDDIDDEDNFIATPEPDTNEMRQPQPGNGLNLLQMLFQSTGPSLTMPGVRAVAVDEDGQEHDVNPVAALLMQALMGGGGGIRGRGAGHQMQNLQDFISNLATAAQQEEAMREMGITQDLDDMSYEQLLELEERIGSVSKGLRAADMTQCLQPLATRPTDGSCPICLERWAPAGEDSTPSSTPSSVPRDDPAVELKHCHHVFHDACIRQWLRDSKQCPVCWQDVLQGTRNTGFS